MRADNVARVRLQCNSFLTNTIETPRARLNGTAYNRSAGPLSPSGKLMLGRARARSKKSRSRLLTTALAITACGAPAAAQGTPVRTESATLVISTGSLAGTLTLPATQGPVPLAILIAGSGPTDRNGNSAGAPIS